MPEQVQFDFSLPRKVEEFAGETFDKTRDGERLTSLLDRVEKEMKDGQWKTLAGLKKDCGGSEASISARIRDLRAAGHEIERAYVSAGLWKYRMKLEAK